MIEVATTEIGTNFLFYTKKIYQSKALEYQIYKKPTLNSNKKSIIDQKPNKSKFDSDTHQGAKNIISISKIINKIAVTQNFTSKAHLASS